MSQKRGFNHERNERDAMSKKPDGGPAFPVPPNPPNYGPTDGMTLRDWFAGQALAAIIAHPGMEPDDCDRDGCAELAYEFADAMIAAREQ